MEEGLRCVIPRLVTQRKREEAETEKRNRVGMLCKGLRQFEIRISMDDAGGIDMLCMRKRNRFDSLLLRELNLIM